MLFVHAERGGTKVNIPVHNVPELTNPTVAARYGRKAKTVRESAESIKTNFIGFGWNNVRILQVGTDGE